MRKRTRFLFSLYYSALFVLGIGLAYGGITLPPGRDTALWRTLIILGCIFTLVMAIAYGRNSGHDDR